MVTWIPAFPLAELPVGKTRVVGHRGARIAVLRLVSGEVLAGDGVRSYPVRVEHGHVLLEVTPRGPEELLTRGFQRLEAATLEVRVAQAGREVVRLLEAGVGPAMLLGWAARLDARRSEHGTTDVLPVAVDAMRLLPRLPGLQAARAVMLAVGLAAVTHAGRPEREIPTAGAEALVRGAVAAGHGRDVLEPQVLRLCHGPRLGHAVKAFDLLDVVGWSDAGDVLGSLVFALVRGPREEPVPPWSEGAELGGPVTGLDPELVTLLLEGRPTTVLAALRGRSARDVLDAVSVAAAERLLRFDPAAGTVEGWPALTRGLTFASAVRHALERLPDADRLVLRAVARVVEPAPLGAPVRPAPGSGLRAAVRAGDVPAALGAVLSGGDEVPDALEDLVLDTTSPPHLLGAAVAAADEHAALPDVAVPGTLAPARMLPLLAVARFAALSTRRRSRRR